VSEQFRAVLESLGLPLTSRPLSDEERLEPPPSDFETMAAAFEVALARHARAEREQPAEMMTAATDRSERAGARADPDPGEGDRRA
jgi:hypothetical protein